MAATVATGSRRGHPLYIVLSEDNVVTPAPGETRATQLLRLQERIYACTTLTALLSELTDELGNVVPVSDRISIVFLEPGHEWMRIYRVLPAVTDELGSQLPRVRVDGTPVGQVVREGKGRVVADVRTDPNITFGHASHDRIRSTLSVPIRVGGRIVGALNAGSRNPGECTEAMLRELEEVAAIVGPATFAVERMFDAPASQPDAPKVTGQAGPEIGQQEWVSLEEQQRRYIQEVLEFCDGVIEGADGAAKLLELRPSTLRSRMARLGLSARSIRQKARR